MIVWMRMVTKNGGSGDEDDEDNEDADHEHGFSTMVPVQRCQPKPNILNPINFKP